MWKTGCSKHKSCNISDTKIEQRLFLTSHIIYEVSICAQMCDLECW